jgi:hypothetical protein
LTEGPQALPEPEPADVPPLLIGRVFENPAMVLDLVKRHGPYWNQSRYQPAGQRAAAATTPAGHPYAMAGGSPPLFRGNWADTSMAAEGVGPLLASPVLHAAARSLFAGRVTATSFLYVNVTAPMPGIDAGHVDVPSFRGLDRRTIPGWFLLAMQRSRLFTRWAIRTATAVVWFYAGAGGALSYWPEGPAGPRHSVPATSNAALVGDNDRMLHRVEAVGDPSRWRAVSRDALLHYTGADRWEVRDHDATIETYRAAELRVSLSWKAEVYLDDADRDRRIRRLDDLTPARVVSVLATELRRQHRWAGHPPADINDPRWTEAIMAAYPRTPPPG